MGVRNSSKTRVVPVLDKLFELDASGANWIPGLLRLGARDVRLDSITPRLVDAHQATWGKDELALPAPLSLLDYLVQNITEQQVERSGDTGVVLENRRALAKRHPETVTQAMQALRTGRRDRQWYVLEGASRPDATLKMPEAVLVIEGKRTERSCTSTTKWMGVRSQLLRHMDAATEFFPGKRVLGLLIVEGEGGADAITPSQHWRDESEAQYSPQMLSASLPHRTSSERECIVRGILGVGTWQALCAQNGILWPPIEDAA